MPKWWDLIRLRNESLRSDFSFDQVHTWGKVVDVYDGDTLRVIIRYHGIRFQLACRMLGYDSPEMRPRKNIRDREKMIDLAKDAKSALIRRVLGKTVWIHFGKYDKYGRPLVTIFIRKLFRRKININEWMVESGYGVPYFGGTKAETLIGDENDP